MRSVVSVTLPEKDEPRIEGVSVGISGVNAPTAGGGISSGGTSSALSVLCASTGAAVGMSSCGKSEDEAENVLSCGPCVAGCALSRACVRTPTGESLNPLRDSSSSTRDSCASDCDHITFTFFTGCENSSVSSVGTFCDTARQRMSELCRGSLTVFRDLNFVNARPIAKALAVVPEKLI